MSCDFAEQAEAELWIELLSDCLANQKTEWVKEEDRDSDGVMRIRGWIVFFSIKNIDIFLEFHGGLYLKPLKLLWVGQGGFLTLAWERLHTVGKKKKKKKKKKRPAQLR